MNQKWDEEKIEKELRRAVGELHLDRMPTKLELADWAGDHKLVSAVDRYGGLKYWAVKLGFELKVPVFDMERPMMNNSQCEKCIGYNMGRCTLLVNPEEYPCFAFRTPEEAKQSRDKAMRRLKSKGLTYLLDQYKAW